MAIHWERVRPVRKRKEIGKIAKGKKKVVTMEVSADERY